MVEVTTVTSLEVIKGQSLQKADALKAMIRSHARRRTRLLAHIQHAYLTLSAALSQVSASPFPTGLQDFKQGFDLFKTQFEIALPAITQTLQWNHPISAPFGDELQDWQDFLDDLEDLQKDLRRAIDHQERDRFLEVIKLLDTIERLQSFELPTPEHEQDFIYHKDLHQLLDVVIATGQYLGKVLRRRGIHSMSLQAGEYPPIEQTRVLFREDGGMGGEIVISRVVEKGFFWKKTVLRKAAVVVTTQL